MLLLLMEKWYISVHKAHNTTINTIGLSINVNTTILPLHHTPTDTKPNDTSTEEVDSIEATIEIIEELTDIHPITEAAKFGLKKSVKH